LKISGWLEDRDIAKDPHTELGRQLVQRGPLAEEDHLAELDEPDLFLMLLPPLIEGLGISARQAGAPIPPRGSAEGVARGPKDRVVAKPTAVQRLKGIEILLQIGSNPALEARKGAPQHGQLERNHLVECHPFGGKVRRHIEVFVGQQAVRHEQIGADQHFVACKSRDRGVRRVAGARRVQRQNLPPAHARTREPAYIGCGARPQIADAETGRQAGWMQNDTGGA
jgi:hypothetical protein